MRRILRAICVLPVLLPALGATGQTPPDKKSEFAAHMQKAAAYLQQRQPAQAIPELEAAVAIDPANVDAQGNLGVLLYFEGKEAESIPHLRAAVEGNADLAKIQGLLGMAEIRTLDWADGRRDLEAAFPRIADTKFQVQVGLELVSLDTQSGELEKATPILAELRKVAPEDPEVLYAAYRTYTDLAGESMLSIAIHAPNSAQMHQMLAHEATREGKTNEAIEEYRKAIALNTNLPGVHFELAELLHTSQNVEVKKQAAAEYALAYKQDPNNAQLLCRMAEMDDAKGSFAEARALYERAVKLAPGSADAKLGLAKTLTDMGKNDEVQPLLEEAVQEEPSNAVAHYRLGTLYRRQGKMDEARREIEIYKKLKDLKDKLRAEYKDLLIAPDEIRADEPHEK